MDWVGVGAALARYEIVTNDARSLIIAVNGVRARVEHVRVFDEDWLLVIAAVCPESRASLHYALTSNMRLALAANAIEQGWLVLRATHPLATLDTAGLDRILRAVTEEAQRLRAVYLPDGATVDFALGHFSE